MPSLAVACDCNPETGLVGRPRAFVAEGLEGCEPAGLQLARTDDIGPHYAPTLRAWREQFMAALPDVRALGFDTPFIRTWLLYLAFSEAAFAERALTDHQLLFTR